MVEFWCATLALVINEVLYDPAGSDSGREFVELLNETDEPVLLDDALRLERGNGASPDDWTAVWSGDGTLLPPDSFLVVGDHPAADRIVTLSLQNGPDACRLTRAGEVVDLVGWGAHDFPEYAEGAPALDPTPGLIARAVDGVDTDDNRADFVAASVATPGAVNFLDYDVAFHLERPLTVPPLPEAGEAFALRLRLENVGRQPLRAGEAGVRAEGRTVWLSEDLPRTAVREVEVPLSSRAEGVYEVPLDGVGLVERPGVARARFAVGGGDVRLNEVMAAPEMPEPEWVELTALGEVDLAGWRLLDGAGGEVALGGLLHSGSFLVVTASPADFLARYPHLSVADLWVVSGMPAINDSDEWLFVAAPDSLLVDAVYIDRAPRGESLERLHPALSGRDPAAFVPSFGGPTPGRANRVVAQPPERAELTITPPVVTEAGSTIRYHLGDGSDALRISVVDLLGDERARLVDRQAAGRGVIHWDGRTEEGRLPPGPFVVLATFGTGSSRVARRAPVAVGWDE